MQTQSGFTKMSVDEFEGWIDQISVTRTVTNVQQHHTWRPNYSHFDGSNHFGMQEGMRHHHVSNNGWSDIGQHFSIFPDGAILTGRPLNKAPACITGKNSGGICIENIGDFDTGRDQMTVEQDDAIIRATAAIVGRFSGIKPNDNGIVYHHWFASKSCPGTAFYGGNERSDMTANFLPKVLAAMGHAAPGPAIAPVVSGVARFVSVTATALNIRTGPGSDHPKITEHGPAEQGSILRVFDEQDGWLKVANSKSHWVFGRHTIAALPHVIGVENGNVRSGPSTEFAILDVMQRGDPIFVIESEDEWRRIGPFHWVHRSLLA